MNPDEVHAYLNSFVNFESQLHRLGSFDFHLNRIRRFLEMAGNPDRGLKIVHVAGTKGKGSTCAFLANILHKAGYTVGLYTSPHLHRRNERIRVLKAGEAGKDPLGGTISDEDLASVLTFLRPYAAAIVNEGQVLTFFEVLTVGALCHFARQKVDIVILETGLGGRLDATNAVDSAVAVITPISFDHMSILGHTLRLIAAEKAGIIKNSHQKVVLAPQPPEAMAVLQERCREFGIEAIMAEPKKHQNLKLGLKGYHQVINAAAAIEAAAVLKPLGFKIDDDALKEGLKTVRWPGRFEMIHKNPAVIADGAHNGSSAKALAETLQEQCPGRRIVLILGISCDKDERAITEPLRDLAVHVFLTKTSHPRSRVFTQAEALSLFGAKPFEIIPDIGKAFEAAFKITGPEDVILVTGSIFIVAEAREYFQNIGKG